MTRLFLALALIVAASMAGAQTHSRASATTSQINAAGPAGVKARMESQGYKDVHALRRGPDGQWIGKASRNGTDVTVTLDPNGTAIAR